MSYSDEVLDRARLYVAEDHPPIADRLADLFGIDPTDPDLRRALGDAWSAGHHRAVVEIQARTIERSERAWSAGGPSALRPGRL